MTWRASQRATLLLRKLQKSNHGVEVNDGGEWRTVATRSNCGQFSMAFAILAVKGRMPFALRGAYFLYSCQLFVDVLSNNNAVAAYTRLEALH